MISDNGTYLLLRGGYWNETEAVLATAYIKLMKDDYKIQWIMKQSVPIFGHLPQAPCYYFDGNKVSVMEYSCGKTRFSSLDPSSGRILRSPKDKELQGRISVIRYFGRNKYLVRTDLRYIKRWGKFLDFDILDIASCSTSLVSRTDKVFPRIARLAPVLLKSKDGKNLIGVFPDKIGILNENMKFTVISPRKGFYFAPSAKLYENSQFKVFELPLQTDSRKINKARKIIVAP